MPDAPLFAGMRPYHPSAGTSSALAQRYFEQGMTLAWGFNPAEAARSFAAATRADPGCAACYWGLAWVKGPNINTDMDAATAIEVAAALQRAQALSAGAPARYRELIAALAARHPGPTAPLDEEAYAMQMRALAQRHPRDAEIATLAAEAELNLHPYDWWEADGTAKPWTGTATDLLARALRVAPDHPGANHYWIHVMESSAHPERALASADRLRTLAPGSGHLLHMPAHIYMRVGRYADASRANEASIAADRAYLEQVDAQRAYRVGYVAHNHHFLFASAAMEGRSRAALAAAQAAYPAACGPKPGDRSTGILQQYTVLPLFARVRFGQWREILEDTLPPDVAEPYPLAIWHYARGTAFARTGRLSEAHSRAGAARCHRRGPGIAANQDQEHQCCRGAGEDREAHAAGGHRCGRGQDRRRRGAARRKRWRSRTASSTTNPTCGWRRRAMRSARRCWPPGATTTRSACTARTFATIPEMAGRWPASRKHCGDRVAPMKQLSSSCRRAAHGAAPTFRCPVRASDPDSPGTLGPIRPHGAAFGHVPARHRPDAVFFTLSPYS